MEFNEKHFKKNFPPQYKFLMELFRNGEYFTQEEILFQAKEQGIGSPRNPFYPYNLYSILEGLEENGTIKCMQRPDGKYVWGIYNSDRSPGNEYK